MRIGLNSIKSLLWAGVAAAVIATAPIAAANGGRLHGGGQGGG